MTRQKDLYKAMREGNTPGKALVLLVTWGYELPDIDHDLLNLWNKSTGHGYTYEEMMKSYEKACGL
jgi:hypothetical protein